MSRWASDPEAAADDLIARSLDDIDLSGRILLANQAGGISATLSERGLAHTLWNRRLAPGFASAAAWPTEGPFDLALLRLPKAKDEQEMAMHACLSVLTPGGRLIIYGGNDEGVRSVGNRLARLGGSVQTLVTRGHGRMLLVQRPSELAALRGALAQWRAVTTIDVAGSPRDWITYPGVFATGRIDEGTALLLGALPALAGRARMLDYGCGSGPIAASAHAHAPDLAIDMLDNDTVALEAARENVPSGRVILGTRLSHAKAHDYAAILSNPPLHRGIAEDHALLHALVSDAPASLAPGGLLQMVVQRRVPLDAMLRAQFADVRVVAENGRYRVWRAASALSKAGRERLRR